jgi:hypothetical protein
LGNRDIDALFGGSARDVFISDVLGVTPVGGGTQTTLRGTEVRDFYLDRDPVNPPAGESVGSFTAAQLDRLIDLPDPGLRLAVAQTLNIPLTLRYDNRPLLARPILASELAGLDRLDASGRGIASLTGLENAINLRSVNLAHNAIGDLAPLEKKTSTRLEDIGSPLGLGQVEFLALDGNPITNLDPLTLLHRSSATTQWLYLCRAMPTPCYDRRPDRGTRHVRSKPVPP